MIIVITNRKLPNTPIDQPITLNVRDLGASLGERAGVEDVIYSGILSSDKNVIDFYPKGEEATLFSCLSDSDRAKSWVVFVHGFNQEPLDNIDKARALSAYHGVNVVAFSWPSKPESHDMGWSDTAKSAAIGVLSGLSGSTILVGLLRQKVKSFLEDKWRNYEPAIKNAEQSNIDLIAALKLINKHLAPNKPPVLLVHSMGNYLLEKTMDNRESLPMKFSNIILHQADADSPDYVWVKKLLVNLDSSLGSQAKAYITVNYADYVLGASSTRRFILNTTAHSKLKTERIGQVRSNHLDCGFVYLDFSNGKWVDNEHEFFQLPKDKTNDYVYDCLHKILKAKPDDLPELERKSNAGFTRIPANKPGIKLYRLENIIHPADYDDFYNYTSLKEYDASNQPKVHDDPDMFG